MNKLLSIIALLSLISCAHRGEDERHLGWISLRWVEEPSPDGPSRNAAPEDRTKFEAVCSYDKDQPETFKNREGKLREGDVIAYWMKKKEAAKATSRGNLAGPGYHMLTHGHLAIVIKDPKDSEKLILYTAHPFKGPHLELGLDSLATKSWDAVRLDKWNRIDHARFYEFVDLSIDKAGNWAGYDFTGMFGLWNSGIEPSHPDEIAVDYICSTLVVAALHYSGLKLDAVNRDGLLDLISPGQVVRSEGCIVPIPDVRIVREVRKGRRSG